MEKDKPDFTPLKDVIAALLTDGTLPFKQDDVNLYKVWAEVVGTAISVSARPSRIKQRRLRVTVSDPIWLQELSYSEESIRKKLNRKLGRTAVDKIEFKVGP